MEKIKQKESILAIVTGLVIIGWFIHKPILFPIAGGIGLVCLLSSYVTEKIHWLWMKISHVLGFVMSKVILSIVFFLFLTPIAILSKLSRKDLLQLKRADRTYYAERNHLYVKDDLENVW
jgi:Saxitoxin biosynthesis operon protein SxtJ